jgi:hypothetical protein
MRFGFATWRACSIAASLRRNDAVLVKRNAPVSPASAAMLGRCKRVQEAHLNKD